RDGALRVVRRRTGNDGHALRRGLDDDLDHATLLGGRHGRRFARAAAGHEKVHALGDLPLDQRPQRPLIHRAAARERRGERGTTASESCRHPRQSPPLPPPPLRAFVPSTSRMVNTPRFPMSQAAATSAPSANTRRSRAMWANRIVSNGASKMNSCVPGTEPVRTLVIGISRPRPRAAALPSTTAVPDGASFLAAWWVSTRCASNPGAAASRRAAFSIIASNAFTPSEKFAAASMAPPPS